MPLIGFVDNFHPPRVVTGWALNDEAPDGAPVFVFCHRGSRLIGVTRPQEHRPDLVSYGTGNYGFRLECSEDILDDDIVHDLVTFTVGNLFDPPSPLHIFPGLKASRMQHTVTSRLNAMPPTEALRIISRFHQDRLPAMGEGVSQVSMPVGYLSVDRIAVLGRDGFVFLVGGTNNVMEMYQASPEGPAIRDLKAGWRGLLHSRAERLSALNIRYLQMVMPEKQSIIPELFTAPLSGTTPHLSALEEIGKDPEIAPCYISVLDMLTQAADPAGLCRRVDSHFTPRGSFLCVKAILDRLGCAGVREEDFFTGKRWQGGDLSRRMLGVPLFEEVAIPGRLPPEVCSNSEPTLHFSYTPSNGDHMGIRRGWTCADAPHPLRVLAFANSFFACGTKPNQVSWWLARAFSEFHFVWSASVDYGLIEEIKPDLVICQTVERYLGTVPVDQ